MEILVSGSLAYDRIMDFPGRFSEHILPEQIHVINVSFTVNSLTENFGGTAGNIAYSLALLGEKPRVVASIGKDYHRYFQWLEENGVATGDIRVVDEELTAGAYITTDVDNNQITGFNPGAMKHQAGFKFDVADPGNAIAIVAPGNIADMAEFAERHRKLGIFSIFDPGQSLPIWEPGDLVHSIEESNVLVANDYEVEMICNRTGLSRQQLAGIVEYIVVTKGEHGAEILSTDGVVTIPGVPTAAVVDPTGCGRRLPWRVHQGIDRGPGHGAGGADGQHLRPLRRPVPRNPSLQLHPRTVPLHPGTELRLAVFRRVVKSAGQIRRPDPPVDFCRRAHLGLTNISTLE